jgi:hypothetical protein
MSGLTSVSIALGPCVPALGAVERFIHVGTHRGTSFPVVIRLGTVTFVIWWDVMALWTCSRYPLRPLRMPQEALNRLASIRRHPLGVAFKLEPQKRVFVTHETSDLIR